MNSNKDKLEKDIEPFPEWLLPLFLSLMSTVIALL